MTIWGSRQLPISWPPLPGEALDSWLQSYAARLHTSTRGLLDHLGVTSSLTRMVNTLTAGESDILAARCGLDAATVSAMTLTRFDGVAVTIDPNTRTLMHPPAWRRQTGSRFCPACLAADGGRWQLRWRLPWTFACTRHACLLLDYCPLCRQRPAPDRPFGLHQPVTTGRCNEFVQHVPGGRSRRHGICGHLLADAHATPLPPAGRILTAQHHLDKLIDAATRGVSGHVGPGGTLTELHLLAFRSLHALHGSPDEAPAAAQQIAAEAVTVTAVRGPLDSYDAATVAAGTAIAVAGHAETGDELIRWIVVRNLAQLSQAEPHKLLLGYRNAGPALTARVLAALDPHLRTMERLTYCTAGSHPHPPETGARHAERRAASLPSLLWPAWALALIPTSRTGATILTALRADLAVMLMLSGTSLNCPDAAALLGQPRHRTNLDACLPGDATQRRAALAALAALATDLDRTPAPVDYTRRRALFSTASIDQHAYAQLAKDHDWTAVSPLQHQLLDNHLRVLLTGSPHPGQRDRRSGDLWNPLTVSLPTAVRAFVHDQARRHLNRHHIHEPLTWQPTLPDKTAWPGVTTDHIDLEQFRAAFATHAGHRCGLRRISETTGLTAAQIRLLARITDLDMPDSQWAALAGWTHQPGDPNGLAELHHQQHLPMIDITRLGLATERSIRNTLTQTGQPPISHHPSKKQIPEQWFTDNFIGTHKTCTQAAAELGISRNTFNKYARLHNVDTRFHARLSDPFAAWPPHRKPSAEVIAACSARRGVEYLRQLLALLNQPSQRAAASTLGISEQILHSRRRYIEQAAGIRLCQPRTAPGQPVELTDQGAAFLRQARTAIRRLDRQQRS